MRFQKRETKRYIAAIQMALSAIVSCQEQRSLGVRNFYYLSFQPLEARRNGCEHVTRHPLLLQNNVGRQRTRRDFRCRDEITRFEGSLSITSLKPQTQGKQIVKLPTDKELDIRFFSTQNTWFCEIFSRLSYG